MQISKLLNLITPRNLVLLLAVFLLWKTVVSEWIDINYNLPFIGAGTIENYGDPHLHYGCWSGHKLSDCEPKHSANLECHKFAQSACNTTNDKLNNCWLPAFRKCSISAPDANCYKYADAYCGGSPGECANCFSGAHETCMAQKGF